jgi:hypothetical protein
LGQNPLSEALPFQIGIAIPESGPGGRQIQIEDPDGNPIELFEPRA